MLFSSIGLKSDKEPLKNNRNTYLKQIRPDYLTGKRGCKQRHLSMELSGKFRFDVI